MVDLHALTERMLKMSDAEWRRKANPNSVWTRLTCLPLLPFANRGNVWVGWRPLLGLIGTVLPKVWFCDRMVRPHVGRTHTVPGDPMPDPLMPPERTNT